jgi:23S rRNA pseudouridine1911/1915/1917 synthase
MVWLVRGLIRAGASALIAVGAVRVDGQPVVVRSARLQEGDELEVDTAEASPPEPLIAEPDVELDVVHADEALLVIDKPPGLVVHPGAGQPTGTLVHGLLARFPEVEGVGPDPVRPGIVHRLDKGTSGLLLVARTDAAHRALVDALAGRRVHRRYRALAWGAFDAPRGLIDAPIGRSARTPTRMTVDERGKEARTRYEVVRTFAEPVEVTELRCTLDTGRTHQIRVHLRSIGHPVVGDARYDGARQSLPVARPFLHAEHLELAHPTSGEPLTFDSRLPPDLQAVLAGLGQGSSGSGHSA